MKTPNMFQIRGLLVHPPPINNIGAGRTPLSFANAKTAKSGSIAPFLAVCAPTRTRTWNPLIKSQLLYQLSHGCILICLIPQRNCGTLTTTSTRATLRLRSWVVVAIEPWVHLEMSVPASSLLQSIGRKWARECYFVVGIGC